MNTIDIIEKPDSIPFEVIQGIIQEAHAENIKKGIVTRTATMSAKELEDRVGKDGVCFVAMDGDTVAGTMSCKEGTVHSWFHNGRTFKVLLIGVLPAYQGKGITSMLFKAVEEEAKQRGFNTLFLDTPEGNTNARQIFTRKGYKHVGYFAAKTGHYSVFLMKWLDGCPFSDRYCVFRYQLKRAYIRCRYTRSGTKRFGI